MTSTTQAIVEFLDPDWRDHFQYPEDAAEHYQRWAHQQWREAYQEVVGEPWDEVSSFRNLRDDA